jgi:anaerobic ribonucleoside-triphosphate reductase activating protein
MKIDRILYPITSLGPGDRLAIWTVGCDRRCADCANPELWSGGDNKNIETAEINNLLKKIANGRPIDGITITGGDPLYQAAELAVLLPGLRALSGDILLYTGFTYNEAEATLPAPVWAIIRKNVSVIVDGPYIESLNDNICAMRGSVNQNIIFLDESKRASYKRYIDNGRTIQNVFYNNKMISVGIHNKDA